MVKDLESPEVDLSSRWATARDLQEEKEFPAHLPAGGHGIWKLATPIPQDPAEENATLEADLGW